MKYFIIDAFAENVFQGNQAGVCLLEEPIDSQVMQHIASENNLAETAFIIRNGKHFDLRWFTPKVEIDLCGHATLASAYVITNFVDKNLESICFNTISGKLHVRRKNDFYEMDFPIRKPEETEVISLMEQALGVNILEAHVSRDLLLLTENEQTVKTLQPNFELLRQLSDYFAIIVTAKGDTVDFVSRFFAPNAGILEDSVTGSSHSTLIPFWSERLGKSKMTAQQLSKRGGTLICENCEEYVKIAGKAALYLMGEIYTP